MVRTLASAYLAKSNIIRCREAGDAQEALLSALDALHTALDRLSRGHDEQLRGIIYLDLGHLNIELYSMTGELSRARDAKFAYLQAETLLQAFPREFSQALRGTAMLTSKLPDQSSPSEIEESISTADKALGLLERAKDLQALARAHVCLGELYALRDAAGDSGVAIKHFEIARSRFLESRNYENAITAARRISALYMYQYEKCGELVSVREAKQSLSDATSWVEQIWNQEDSVDWRYAVSDRFSNVYADIAWCQAVLNESIDEIAFTAARAKGREFLTHSQELRRSNQVGEDLGEYVDRLRVESRLAERERWRASRKAKPNLSLDEQMSASRQQLDEIDSRRRLLFPRPVEAESVSPRSTVEAFLATHPKAIILDITVSRWGTVALLFGGAEASGLAGQKIVTLPLKSSSIMRPAWEWLAAYRTYLESKGLEREDARKPWADATDRLLEVVGLQVMQPCLAGLDDQTLASYLIIAAGRMAGLPLHAARLADGRFVAESVGTVEYIPNLTVLSPKEDTWEHPKTALCVVSDPGGDLKSAAIECNDVAKSLRQNGTRVSLLASVGQYHGSAAFKQRGVVVASGAEVLDGLPTPRRVAALMLGKDHFFYSGHGTRQGGQSGLVLVNEDGKESLLSEDEILSMPALRHRPLVVLSACETARGEQGSSEIFDFASCLLRIGARYVVGSLWVVFGDCATVFTAAFYSALQNGTPPNLAFGAALRELKKLRATHTTNHCCPR